MAGGLLLLPQCQHAHARAGEGCLTKQRVSSRAGEGAHRRHKRSGTTRTRPTVHRLPLRVLQLWREGDGRPLLGGDGPAISGGWTCGEALREHLSAHKLACSVA